MHYLKLALRTGVMESISDSLIDPKNMEDEIINKLFDESFIKVVDSAIKDDRKRSIIHDRLGLDDQDGMLTSEIGKKYNFSGSYATDVINKTLVKLKDNKKINKYIKM